MMRRLGLVAGAVALVVLLMPAGTVFANPVGATGTLQNTELAAYGSGGYGEYTIFNYTNTITNAFYSSLTSDLNGGGFVDYDFQSFCIEVNETSYTPVNFVVGTAAIAGGVGGNPDPISEGTAFLYNAFARGVLANYFGVNRAANAALLQLAIWALEQEAAAPAAGVNPFYDLAIANGGTADAAAGYLGVYVLNTYRIGVTNGDNLSQDFLYYEKTVPEGGVTLMLLGGALMGMGALRRKLRG